MVPGHDWWPVRRPGHVTGPTNHHQLNSFQLVFSKGATQLFNVLSLFVGLNPSVFFLIYVSQHISWEKIICRPRCVSPCTSRRHLIIDVCKAQILLVTSRVGSQPGARWCFVEFFYCPICSEAQRSVRSASSRRKYKHNFTFIVQYTHRPFFFRSHSVHRSWFLFIFLVFVFLFLIFIVAVAAKELLELHKLYRPLLKTWIPPRPPIPRWNCWEKTLQRGRSSCRTVHAANCTGLTLGTQ